MHAIAARTAHAARIATADGLAGRQPASEPNGTTVLFVCLHNAGLSQMSEALFGRRRGGLHTGLSAGTNSAEHVHPEVVEVMQEVGIDLSDRVPTGLCDELAAQADVVVRMGCGDACPYIPGTIASCR